MIGGGAIILGKTTMCDYGMLASGYSSGLVLEIMEPSFNSGGSAPVRLLQWPLECVLLQWEQTLLVQLETQHLLRIIWS